MYPVNGLEIDVFYHDGLKSYCFGTEMNNLGSFIDAQIIECKEFYMGDENRYFPVPFDPSGFSKIIVLHMLINGKNYTMSFIGKERDVFIGYGDYLRSNNFKLHEVVTRISLDSNGQGYSLSFYTVSN
nr:hypothetical protein [uncultured Pseudodesulfovibrio sp.]